MLQQGIALLMLPSGVLLFQQNDFKGDFERMELVRYNDEYITSMKVITYKYNRTTPVENLTYTCNQNLGWNTQVVAQSYTFLSNEYRLFPMRFQFGYCDAIRKNDFGLGGLLACGNLTDCAIKKGTYHICKWTPDDSRYPPHIPNGKYRVDLQLFYGDVEILVLRFYATIYRPFV